jgi:hypothetical protein
MLSRARPARPSTPSESSTTRGAGGDGFEDAAIRASLIRSSLIRSSLIRSSLIGFKDAASSPPAAAVGVVVDERIQHRPGPP